MPITVDPKTGYSPELKARVEAEIARAKTFEPLAAADPDADLAWLVSDKDDVDVGYRFETPPPDLDFVWPGFLAGSVGALVAPGATPDGHPKLLHLWPVKLLQAGQGGL